MYPDLGLVVMTEGQVLARRKKTQVKKSNRDKVKSYTDLTPGDLVVHEHHGIGRFIGMERMTVDGSERDFIKLRLRARIFCMFRQPRSTSSPNISAAATTSACG